MKVASKAVRELADAEFNIIAEIHKSLYRDRYTNKQRQTKIDEYLLYFALS